VFDFLLNFEHSGSVPELDGVAVRVVVDSYQFAVAPSRKLADVDNMPRDPGSLPVMVSPQAILTKQALRSFYRPAP
jgi:hypothetical protein